MGLHDDGGRDGAAAAKAPKHASSGSSTGNNMSLTAVRKKESKRVRTKESATVSMLTKLLDDDGTAGGGGSRKQQAKKRRMSQQHQHASNSGRSSGDSGSGGSRAAVPSFRSANSGSKTNHNKHGKHVSAGGRPIADAAGSRPTHSSASAGAWSDIVSAASTGSTSANRGNPFASTSRVGLPTQNMKSKAQASAAAAERAKSLSLARKRAAVMAKNNAKVRHQQQAKNQQPPPSIANSSLAVSAPASAPSGASGASAAASKRASGDQALPQSLAKARPETTTKPPIPTSTLTEHMPKASAAPLPSEVDPLASKHSDSKDVPPDMSVVSLGLHPTSLMGKKKRPARPRMGGKVAGSAASFALKSDANDTTSGTFAEMGTNNDGHSSRVLVEASLEVTGRGGTGSSSADDDRTSAATDIAVAPGSTSTMPTTRGNSAKRTFDADPLYRMSDGSTSHPSAVTHDVAGVSSKKRRKAANNDNFVKLNLRNSAGSCRGARNKKGKRGGGRYGGRYGGRGSYGRGGGSSYNSHQKPYSSGNGNGDENERDNDWKNRRKEKGGVRLVQNASAGIDPLDDYLDGTYAVMKKGSDNKDANKIQLKSSAPRDTAAPISTASTKTTADEEQASQTKARAEQIPRCNRHRRPCKLLKVKKSNTGNKGRKFYVCGLPKGEQCDFFQWEDDTVHSIQRSLLQSSSASGFVARQVAAYVDRFKALTLPELRDEAKRLGLRHVGKKGQLLARLTIHIRDEVAKSVVADEKGSDGSIIDLVPSVDDDSKALATADDDDDDSCSSSSDKSRSSSSSSEDDELELVGDGSNDNDDAPAENFVDSMSDEECAYGDDNRDEEDSDPINTALHKYFGYRDFRPGQEWAIRRVLQQERSLLVAPTGLGKSMCYALPATQLEGVCLVVSPLISLMQDQLRHLPPNIPAATLSGNLSSVQVAMTIDDLMKNRIKILFVSPERLASPAFRRLIRPKFNTETRQYERQFPTVSLLCLDEAHCLSQWGHNFRPSYLRIRSLVPLLEPKSILALTATAGPMVIKDISHTLGIPMSNVNGSNNDGVRVLDCKRDNIDVATLVMESEDSRRSLLYKILKDKNEKKKSDDRYDLQLSKRMTSNSAIQPGCLSKGNVIVYVWRQRDAETVTEQLLGAGIEGGVVCYHGGMGAGDRAKAQGKFMRGKARICVATVAFGLGINKADVKGVIHLCLPPSLEHYSQEIGRAGRNGDPARAIALVLSDEVRIRSSLSHSDCIARSQVEKLCLVMRNLVDNALSDVAPTNESSDNSNGLVSLSTSIEPVLSIDIALPISATVGAIDCKEAMVETMLSLLEESTDSSSALLSVEGNLTDEVIVTLKRRSLDKLCAHESIARSIEKCSQRLDEKEKTADISGSENPLEEHLKKEGGTALQKGFLAYSLGTYKFSVLRCARFMGPRAEPRHVFAALRRLQSSGELELALDRTEKGKCLHLRLNTEGIACFRSPASEAKNCDVLGAALISVIDRLTSHCSKQVSTGSIKVEKMHQVIHRVTAVDSQDNKRQEKERCDGTVDCTADADDASSVESSSVPGSDGKSARLILFQKLAKEYFENEGKENGSSSHLPQEATASSTTAGGMSVPEIAKELSSKDTREYARLASDTISLMRDSNLRQKGQEYPIAVSIGDSGCTDYASCCLTKILHGIDSTRAPMSDWRMHPLFGKWRHCSFTSVRSCVEAIIKESMS